MTVIALTPTSDAQAKSLKLTKQGGQKQLSSAFLCSVLTHHKQPVPCVSEMDWYLVQYIIRERNSVFLGTVTSPRGHDS